MPILGEDEGRRKSGKRWGKGWGIIGWDERHRLMAGMGLIQTGMTVVTGGLERMGKIVGIWKGGNNNNNNNK